jgi:hypothetical protein
MAPIYYMHIWLVEFRLFCAKQLFHFPYFELSKTFNHLIKMFADMINP